MQILINQCELIDDTTSTIDKKKLIKELDLEDYDIEVSEADIGCGADWWFIALIIGGIFFSGKKIEENIEAWVKIGKRIKNILEIKKDTDVFIDEEAAISLAIESILNKATEVESIELLHSNSLSEFGLDEIYEDGRRKDQLITTPYNFYTLVFKVNGFDKYVYCIKSNGEIRYKDIFLENPSQYKENWDTIQK